MIVNDMKQHVKGFLSVAHIMREAGQTDKEIIAAFNIHVITETGKGVKRSKAPTRIPEAIRCTMKKIKSSKQPVDYFNLFYLAGFDFNCNYRIGRIVVSFLINENLVFEIVDEVVPGRREFLEHKGYLYITVDKWTAETLPQAVIDEIGIKLESIDVF
jgi:hypothetical protein